MRNTLIINCSHCGGLLLAADDQKTRTCPYCGVRVDIRRANKVASADNPFEASLLLRGLKAKRQTNVRGPEREK